VTSGTPSDGRLGRSGGCPCRPRAHSSTHRWPAEPGAQVAGGDLALGRRVDEISHSKYWPESAFIVEGDSQAGLDYIDGHCVPVQILSPWTQHGVVDNTYFAVAASEDRNCKICVNYHLSAEYPDRYVYGHLGAQ
jgi:hypothetical protein